MLFGPRVSSDRETQIKIWEAVSLLSALLLTVEYTAETRGLEGNANDLEAGVGTYAGRLEAGGGRQDSRGSCAR